MDTDDRLKILAALGPVRITAGGEGLVVSVPYCVVHDLDATRERSLAMADRANCEPVGRGQRGFRLKPEIAARFAHAAQPLSATGPTLETAVDRAFAAAVRPGTAIVRAFEDAGDGWNGPRTAYETRAYDPVRGAWKPASLPGLS